MAHATDFVRTLAPKFHLDLDNVIVIGHSAGGHLAIWDAARHKIPKESRLYTADPLPLRGAVSRGGWALDIAWDIEHPTDPESSAAVGTLFPVLGVQTTEEALQRVTNDGPSPTQLLPLEVPQYLFTGTSGGYEHVALRYAQAAAAAGDSVTATVFKGATHFDHVDPCGPAWLHIIKAVSTLVGQNATPSDLRGPSAKRYRTMHLDQQPPV